MDPMLEQRLQALEQDHLRLSRVEREVTRWRRLAGLFALVSLVLLAPRAGVSQTAGATLEERVKLLETKVANLQNRFAHVTRSGNNLIITGANLHLRNGLKATNGSPQSPQSVDPEVTRTNGLGNLILGYNELRGNGVDARTGSHNLVVGPYHSYSSWGGLAAGYYSTLSAPAASVSGGRFNTAGGEHASVSGGSANWASGLSAAVSGGTGNRASGESASVSGGRENAATALSASVSGGHGNTAGNWTTTVSGGAFNAATAQSASVSGGYNNSAAGVYASVSGGWLNTASGPEASVSGGKSNTVSGQGAAASGGTGIHQSAENGWSAGTYTGTGFGLYQGRFRAP